MTMIMLGPSIGTTVASCWGPTVALLRGRHDLVGLELPVDGADLSISDLASRALELTDGPFVYAGESVGGQVGLQLLLDAPDRVLGAVLCCTGAKIGTEQSWAERRAQVRATGTAGLVSATAGRWFGPGFLEREPERASALLHALRDTDDAAYLSVVDAIAAYDVRDRLGGITAPVIAVAGAVDPVCPPDSLREIAEGVQDGRLVVLEGVAHQAPVEAPAEVARLIDELAWEVG